MPDIDFEQILSDSSRSLADYVVAVAGDDPVHFDRLFTLSVAQKPRISMRASRVVDFICEKNPGLARSYQKKIIRALPRLMDESVKRNFLHILTRHPWVEDDRLMGSLVDTLFRWLQEESQSIAVKAYSMVILEKIILLLPDLKNELILVIEEASPYWNSPGLQVQARRTITNLTRKS